MKYVDVLNKYLEAMGKGYTHDQAEVLVSSWAESMELHPESATKDDLQVAVQQLGTELKVFLSLVTIVLILFFIFFPLIKRYLGLS